VASLAGKQHQKNYQRSSVIGNPFQAFSITYKLEYPKMWPCITYGTYVFCDTWNNKLTKLNFTQTEKKKEKKKERLNHLNRLNPNFHVLPESEPEATTLCFF
jgi:hypothetical protein